MKKKSLLIGIAVLVAAGLGAWFYFNPAPVTIPPVAVEHDPLFGWKFPVVRTALGQPGQNLFDFQIAYSDIRDPGGIPSGLPVRLTIPVIGVNAAIEDAYITPDGRMDVPAGTVNVAWFALGPQPGEVGSAVIGGHYGLYGANKGPTVFYRLDNLKIGDKVYIVDDRGDTITFVVRNIKLFNRDADATTVFTSSDGIAHLNLITCEGIWNKTNDTYPQRRVVFTDKIANEGLAQTPNPTPSRTPTPTPVRSVTPAPTPTVTPAPRTLFVGTQGADVEALQNRLVEKELLVIPPGTTKGYYGASTEDAVAQYQTSVGLPSTGVYDMQTRTSLESTQLPQTGDPTPTPSATPFPAASPAPTPESAPSNFIRSLRSVFATPIDGLITSVLLLAVGYLAFKIIRRP